MNTFNTIDQNSSTRNPSTMRRLSVATIALAIGSIGAAACSAAEAADPDDRDVTTLEYDVAENALAFVFEPDLVFEDGNPAYGSAFVTQGYIYSDGTLGDGEDGVDENGDPTLPDDVVGTWTCHGHMIGDGARSETGAWVVSTQIYDIDGVGTIVTDGTELVDLDIEIDRAVTGGTGSFAGAEGVQTQRLTGFNELMGVTLDVEIEVSGSGVNRDA